MEAGVKHILFTCLLAMSVAEASAQCLTPKEKKLQRKIFTKVEVMPEFPGGPDGWRRFLEKTLQLPEESREDSCWPQFTYKCFVTVETDGSLSNITVNNKCDTSRFCGGEKMCFYTLKKSPKWLPGKQNGKAVPVRLNQNIGIEVGE